jgi:hypothetical protein
VEVHNSNTGNFIKRVDCDLLRRIETKTASRISLTIQSALPTTFSTTTNMGAAMKDPVGKTEKDPVAQLKQLLRMVVRMFYETDHIVLMDALCYHGALPIAEMTQILDAGKNSKAVGKIAGKLREAGLCSS